MLGLIRTMWEETDEGRAPAPPEGWQRFAVCSPLDADDVIVCVEATEDYFAAAASAGLEVETWAV